MRDWIDHLPFVVRQSWPAGGRSFFGASPMTTKNRLIVLHSTETTGFPGYNGGAANPHFTIDLRTGEVRQHVPLSWGSRCLAVSTEGVRDVTVNVTGTIQIETVGAVTPGYPERYGHYDLPKAFPGDERAQRHLARLLKAIHDETDIPLETSSYARWVAYPGSYGVRAAQRLSSAAFRDARGVVGHQHAPANNHGDGLYGRAVNGKAVDLEKVLSMAKGIEAPDEAPDFSDTPSPANNFFFPESRVRTFQQIINDLIEMGLLEIEPLKVDGQLAGDTMGAVRVLQRDLLEFKKEDQDGLPGPDTTQATGEMMTAISEMPADVWRESFGKEGHQARSWLRGANLKAGAAQAAAETAVAQIAALTEAVKALAAGQGLDPGAIEAAAERGATRALDGYRLTLERVEDEAGEEV